MIGVSARSNVLQVYEQIKQALAVKRPFSLVRLGDGEGRVLGFPDLVSKEQLNFSLDIWFGHTDFSCQELSELALQLRSAVKNADVIGFPREKQRKAQQAYQWVFDSVDQFRLLLESATVTDAAIHRYLQFTLLYRELLLDRDFVGLINGRDISFELKKIFNIQSTCYHFVPGESKYIDAAITDHYPKRFFEIKNEISVPYSGALYLVGAGALGKVYCQWVKQQGGVALDIGSIFDSWAGVGRLQHEAHSLKHYDDEPVLTKKEMAERYNQYCKIFGMDAPKL